MAELNEKNAQGDTNDMLEAICHHRIVMIYRGQTPEECLQLTKALMEVGIKFFEVTLNSPHAIESIKLLKSELGEQVYVGAGTVLTPDEVDQVQKAGGTYIISPNTNTSVIARTKQLGMFSIPAAFTPTEITNALDAGADMLKIFPINMVGAEHIKQIKGPLNNVPFMATGGIQLDLVNDLFQAGVDAIGIGVHLLGKELVDNMDLKGLQDSALQYLKATNV